MFDIPNLVRPGFNLNNITSLNHTTSTGLQQDLRGNQTQRQAINSGQTAHSNVQPSQSNSHLSSTSGNTLPEQQRSHRQTPSGMILKKGQKVKLESPNNGSLDFIDVGLGWDLGPNGQGYDLDVEAFLLGSDGKVIGDDWFVFYNQRVSPDGAVICGNDNVTGMGSGDDETVKIQLSRVDPKVDKIVFIVTINEALEHGYNFSNVSNAYVRIIDKASNQELIRFHLTDYYASVCSMVVGELYKYNSQWKFNAVGNGLAQDLSGLCSTYGVNVV